MFKYWILPAILFVFFSLGEGLTCYHCHESIRSSITNEFVACNKQNLTASNTMVCPSPKAECIVETVEITSTKEKQVWRTCSNGITDPCDPNNMPPGIKMIKCKSCKTDRCNLEAEEEQQPFTFNINANINLVIRQ